MIRVRVPDGLLSVSVNGEQFPVREDKEHGYHYAMVNAKHAEAIAHISEYEMISADGERVEPEEAKRPAAGEVWAPGTRGMRVDTKTGEIFHEDEPGRKFGALENFTPADEDDELDTNDPDDMDPNKAMARDVIEKNIDKVDDSVRGNAVEPVDRNPAHYNDGTQVMPPGGEQTIPELEVAAKVTPGNPSTKPAADDKLKTGTDAKPHATPGPTVKQPLPQSPTQQRKS